MTDHGDVRANRRIAAQFVRNDRMEALAHLQATDPDTFALLRDDVRRSAGSYIQHRDVFLATTGGPIDAAPASGAALLNRALRAASGRTLGPPDPAEGQDG